LIHRFSQTPWRALPAWLIGNRLKILMYHSISNNPRDPHAITPQKFRSQMKSLQTKRVVSLMEGVSLLRNGFSLRGVYVITFDDALLDFYTQALPVVREFGYPVTIFIPTGIVGGKAMWDSYDTSKFLMTWQQLDECQQWSISFGSHTVNHVRLPECDDATMIDELTSSLHILQERLGNVIPALAYPGGYYDDRVREATRQAGYVCAFIASSRWGNGPESDLLQLRRQRFSE